MLLFSTDGITEAENAQVEEFGDERPLQAARTRDGSALEIQRVIFWTRAMSWMCCSERETRRIPRLPPLSFCGTPQGGGAGRPHQTVARPFAKLNRPLRGATAVRRDLSERMVRESWFGIWVGRIGP
jgi:hypothetical protein